MEPTPKTPAPPSHLSKRARDLWRKLNEQYEFECDALATLTVALENLDLADKAREQLDREGITVDGRRHPATDVLKQCHGLYLRALRQLGLDVVPPGPIGRPPGR
jgi:phage terminase small subunit